MHPDDILRLKTAFRSLLEINGGAAVAATKTRICPSALYQHANLTDARYFAPVDVVLALETACNRPLVTEVLAHQSGYVLQPIVVSRDCADLPLALARFGKESSDIFAQAARSLADGALTPAEARALLPDVWEAVSVLSDMAAQLSRRASERPGALGQNYKVGGHDQ